MKPLTIKDNNGVDYEVRDVRSFHRHILRFHADGSSLHEENGRCFTVDDAFRNMVEELLARSSA